MEVAIGDRKFDVHPLLLEKVGDKISELVHMPIAGLIGLDIMDGLGCIEISEKEGYVGIGRETEIGSGDYSFPFEVKKGFRVLTTDLKVNGKDAKVILDSGARIDYMDPSILDTTSAVSHEMDYNIQQSGRREHDKTLCGRKKVLPFLHYRDRCGSFCIPLFPRRKLQGNGHQRGGLPHLALPQRKQGEGR